VRTAIRARHYSRRPEDAYVHWIRRFIVFHGRRHPRELGAPEISGFLTWLAGELQVAASTQNQALSGVLFLYREVLHQEIGAIELVPRARTPTHVPVVLSPSEVRQVLDQLTGVQQIIAMLLYGAGLRLQECLELRVKDLDFERHEITVRRGKGQKDRRVMLPNAVRERLEQHLVEVRRLHHADLGAGLGRVVLPGALDRKYPAASTDWSWQFVFPAGRICRDERFGPPSRFHLHESAVQRSVTDASRKAGLAKRVGCHTLRHSRGSDSGVAVWVRQDLTVQPFLTSSEGSYVAGVVVLAAGRERVFLSVHVGPPNYRKHLRKLAEVLSAVLSDKSFLVAGDLNAARNVDAVYGGKWFTRYFADLERRGLHDCHWALHERECQSFWGHQTKNPYQCDHVFVDVASGSSVLKCDVVDNESVRALSDHGPLTLELREVGPQRAG
jgi:integron integrase